MGIARKFLKQRAEVKLDKALKAKGIAKDRLKDKSVRELRQLFRAAEKPKATRPRKVSDLRRMARMFECGVGELHRNGL